MQKVKDFTTRRFLTFVRSFNGFVIFLGLSELVQLGVVLPDALFLSGFSRSHFYEYSISTSLNRFEGCAALNNNNKSNHKTKYFTMEMFKNLNELKELTDKVILQTLELVEEDVTLKINLERLTNEGALLMAKTR